MAQQIPLEKKLVKTYQVKCRGIVEWDSNKPALSKEDSELVIVRIYGDGHSNPLCRYIRGNRNTKCSAGPPQEEDLNLPVCLYGKVCG